MKRSTKQLLSMLLAIVMVIGLAVPAMAARPMGGDAVETPAGEAAPQVGHSGKTAQPVAELTAAGAKKTLNASEMTEFTNSGDQQKTDGATEVVDSFFTIHYGARDKCDANKKTFDDNFSATQRLNFGAATDFTKGTDYIEFTTTEPTLVKLWWVANKKDRPTAIYKSTDTATAVWSSGDPGEDNKLMMSSKYLADSATYYIGFPGSGGNYIFKIEAISVAAEPTTTNAALGKPSITVAANAETAGTYDVTVTGVAIGKVEDASYNVTQNAEKVVVSAYKNAASEAAASVTITKYTEASGSNVASFDLSKLGTGSYTFKAVAHQGETTTESATSAAEEYVLPLAKPEVTAKGDDGKVTLTWAAVAEATSYEVYQGETKLEVTPTEDKGTCTAVVTGLTNGTEYTFTVKALRADPQAETTSDAVTATPSVEAVGAPQTYTFNAGDITGYEKKTVTAARNYKAGTANHFTVYDNPGKSEVVSSDIATGGPFDDGFVPTQRFSTGGKFSTLDSGTISFDVAMSATIKVWWGNNGANRPVAIYQGTSTTPKATDGAQVAEKDNAIISTFKVTEAGTYTISGTSDVSGGIYIYKILVTETKPAETMTFNAGDITGYEKKTVTAARNYKAGTANFFTVYDNPGKSEVVSSDIATGGPFDDGFAPTQRFSTGGKFSTLDSGTIAFTTTEAAKVKVWWGNNGANREIAIYKGTSTTPLASDGSQIAEKDNAIISSFKTTDADTYTIGGTSGNSGGIYIYKITVTYGGGQDEVTVPWTSDAIGTPTIKSATAANGEIQAVVTGVGIGAVETDDAITTYADKVVVSLYNEAGTLVDSEDVTKLGGKTAENTVSFAPPATGKYTVKAAAVRDGETDIEGQASEPVTFTLPLAVPAIASASSNGAEAGAATVSMTVAWASVAEANSYNLYYRVKNAAEWSGPITVEDKGTSRTTATVTGLTAGETYEFAVEAVRNAGTINGVTVTAETTDKSAVEEGVALAKKTIPWTEVVFGTSTTDRFNAVVKPGLQLYDLNADKKDEPVETYTADGNESITVNDNGDYTLTLSGQEPRTIAGLTGDLNTDPEGRVLLFSHEGAGKIKEGEGADGQLFYYTAIPAGTNYTLTADAEVLRWITRDTQNGFGLAAMDRVADKSWTGSASSNSGNYWNNVYYAGAARGSFSYDSKNGKTYSNKDAGYDSATKYSYYMGPYAIVKTGTPLVNGVAYDGSAAPANYYERRFPLDTRLAIDGRTAKYESNTNRFNLIGNYTVSPKGYYATYDSASGWMKNYELTKVKIQLQKNNTGYISTMWDETGTNMLGQNIEYFVNGAMELSGDTPYHADDESGRKDIPELQQCLDSDFEYVGLFTSRDIDVLFTNVQLTTIDPADDAPAEKPPVTSIIPTMSISSGTSSNSADFTLSVTATVEGTVSVKQNGAALPEPYEIKYNASGETERLDIPVTLATGNTTFEVTFNPDPDQTLPPYTVLDNTNPITKTSVVTYNPNYKYLQNIYVSPKGNDNGFGTKSQPLDIYTAVSVVSPGQNIVLMEGVYNLQKGISIGRGMSGFDGTVTLQRAVLDENGDPVVDEETGAIVTEPFEKDARIYMVADVDENGDPVKVVLNGQRKYSVLTQGASYWVFKDFEVVGSSGTGFQVSGNYNLVQNVKLHDNLSTGLQISRFASGDRIPERNGAEPSIDGDLKITDWGDWPCNNIILNCESYRNYDSGYGGADGFGAKETCGAGNIFDGCAAYWNSDDGWDLFAKTEPDKGPLGRVTLKNCVTFENGYEVRKLDASGAATYDADGNAEMNYDAQGNIIKVPAGNGNGFKLGGSHLPGAHSITNSFAFYNKAKGFDSNNGPDIKVIDCTAYNNGEENVGLGSNFTPRNYKVEGTVSFKDDTMTGEKMADATPSANGDTSVYNYYQWDGTASKGVGTVSGNITAANFVSLDFDNTKWVNGAPRDETGALDLGTFLQLTGVTGAGATQDKVEPETPVVTPDNVIDPPQEGPSKDTSRRPGGGNPGTIAGAIEDANKTDEGNKTETTFNANKTTDSAGNTEIVVKDETGETVADVKIPATIPDSDVVFEDAVGHWAEDAIEDMAALGIVNGIGDNTYGVDSDVTRGALATMLFRLANGKLGIGNTFGDVASGEWYTDAIGWAVKVGVVTGYPDDTFKPGDSITREQLATMLARFAKLVGLDVSADSSDLAGYKDVSDVDSWATDGMAWCVKNGVINGVSADSLSPDTSATRAQTATMLSRFIDLLK